MSVHVGEQAVVIGAGMAGMPAARVLSDFFDRVIVLESDALPAEATARPGTPQARHLHVLLAGGQRALESLFPGFTESLAAAGAQRMVVATDARHERPGYGVFPRRDLGFCSYSMTRPLLESVVRKYFAAIANIEIRQGCRAQQLLSAAGSTAVTGVSCACSDGRTEEIRADLVVDCSSHGQPTLHLLEALGFPAPIETQVGVDIGYSTAMFEIPADARQDWKAVMTFSDPPRNRRGAILVPIEGGAWLVSVAGSHDSKPPEGEEGFFEFLQQLPTSTIYNAVKGAKQVGGVVRYGLKASRRRHFDQLESFPTGLLPFGDTICRFNPTYGQGMSVAAKEAVLLQSLLQATAAEGKKLDELTAQFLTQAQPIVDAPWATAVTPDFRDPLTTGERPADLEEALKFGAAVMSLAYKDPAMHKLMIEVQHLLKPRSVLREPEILEMVKAEMAAMEAVPAVV